VVSSPVVAGVAAVVTETSPEVNESPEVNGAWPEVTKDEVTGDEVMGEEVTSEEVTSEVVNGDDVSGDEVM